MILQPVKKTMLSREDDRVAGELEGVKTRLELDRRRKKLENQDSLAKHHF